jgi:hypothetical protein
MRLTDTDLGTVGTLEEDVIGISHLGLFGL